MYLRTVHSARLFTNDTPSRGQFKHSALSHDHCKHSTPSRDQLKHSPLCHDQCEHSTRSRNQVISQDMMWPLDVWGIRAGHAIIMSPGNCLHFKRHAVAQSLVEGLDNPHHDIQRLPRKGGAALPPWAITPASNWLMQKEPRTADIQVKRRMCLEISNKGMWEKMKAILSVRKRFPGHSKVNLQH